MSTVQKRMEDRLSAVCWARVTAPDKNILSPRTNACKLPVEWLHRPFAAQMAARTEAGLKRERVAPALRNSRSAHDLFCRSAPCLMIKRVSGAKGSSLEEFFCASICAQRRQRV